MRWYHGLPVVLKQLRLFEDFFVAGGFQPHEVSVVMHWRSEVAPRISVLSYRYGMSGRFFDSMQFKGRQYSWTMYYRSYRHYYLD
jgi:hypothetical protein